MMQNLAKIVIPRARDEVRDRLRALIVGGGLASGARVEEVEVAHHLGVSRTPVREALIALEAEGLVEAQPHRGYRVAPADAALVRETYPILAALEATALRMTGPAIFDAVLELRTLTFELGRETRRERQYELDHAFHRRLVSDCGNSRLLTLIEIEHTRASRFDGAHRRGTADRDGSCADHLAIVEAIAAQNLDGAERALLRHWERGVEVVTDWLEGYK